VKANICVAPILNEVDTSIHSIRFDGTFMKENEFRKEASPEVDAAWKALGSDCKASRSHLPS
jgi:hypothetical protein